LKEADLSEETQFKSRTPFLGKAIHKSKKIGRYFELARNMAYNSPYGKLRHGAVLVRGGSVLNTSFNKDKFNSFGSRFREQHRGPATMHAEIGCILGLSRDVTSGTDIYVCRINKKGDFRYSKPCAMCHQVLKHVGIKRVYYTTNEDVIEMYKL